MKSILFSFLFVIACTLNAQEIPLANFVQHGDYLDMQLSPDGKHIAARVRSKGRIFLVILDTETMSVVGGLKPENNDIIHSVTWVSNERYVFEYAEKFGSFDQPIPTGELYASNVDGSSQKLIYGYRAGGGRSDTRMKTKKNEYASQEVLSLLKDDDKHILIIEYPWTLEGNTYYDKREKRPHISRLNVYSGRKKKLEVLPHRAASALATNHGEVNFMSWSDEDGHYYSAYRKSKDEDW